MKTLPPVEKPAYLLAFDFDGTLVNPDDRPPTPVEFFQLMQQLRESHQSLWGINTGRSLMQTMQGLSESAFPFLPDFIIAREREIYTPNNFGRWLPVSAWNKCCEKDHKKLFRKHRRAMKRMQQWVEQETAAVWGQQEGEPAGIVASTVEEMNLIVHWLEQQLLETPLLGYQRNGIYLRFSHQHYHKGSALAEVGRLSGVPAAKTFAIGDSHNDLDMLDVSLAAHIACPANACLEVKQRVADHGGYLAQGMAGQGVIEALQATFSKSQ
ncbi:HAD-IIB family hydrolase [Verrucomicrobiaceae bacterium 5K15]|uniref:HAD-IIB family hydrolase n=1 Tax=Oceaniferula flava TaxID=2800421 RepID=A0AAE2VBL4_9BACT|nr:HAD-IIB family hydrolase [Oceaniferula flavus]MBK1853931.1 HAD-IIB family hydrolase [Oceaniferula flavus]MBM1135237.1 HAD-IIB family hydrolase [Oceaniferula flavus]